jgi:RNA polymerase sigma-70 factor, ECF subfamily
MEFANHLTELILAAKRGDRKAFDDLVGRYGESMDSQLRRRLGRRMRKKIDVDDLRQEAFLRAFQSLGQFRGETAASFGRWLSTIAEHVVLDQARRQKARGAARGEVSLDQGVPAGEGEVFHLEEALAARADTPSQALRRDERFDRLKKVLGTLAPDHAQVIFLARVKALPIKEVARRMQRTPEATSMLLLRALLKLKAAFGHTESLHLPPRSLEQEGGKNGWR